MHELWSSFRDFFSSLKLTVVLLVLSILLIFWATLAQVKLGVWGVQEHFFRTFFVLGKLPGTEIPIPVFPGGYFIGGLLLLNLSAAHFARFTLKWSKSGIALTHLGLVILLIGELLSGLWQEEYSLRLDEGQTRNYSESFRLSELALIDTTDAQFDDVYVVPEKLLARGKAVIHPPLPFRIVPKAYYPNASLQMRDPATAQNPSLATQGLGLQVTTTPLALTYKMDERNLPAAYVELIAPEGSLGTWLVSGQLAEPQTFTHAGRTWQIALRLQRNYKPYSLTLLNFSHDRYAGTDIPKNFSSRIRLTTPDGREDREVLIYMNNPLRYAGLTFYQSGFDNNDRTTVLQVVRNPSWLLPYIACALMGLGLCIQFGISLFAFVARRRAMLTG
jgi:hypothetical protein